MTLIVQSDNPAESAPKISFNHCGQMPGVVATSQSLQALNWLSCSRSAKHKGAVKAATTQRRKSRSYRSAGGEKRHFTMTSWGIPKASLGASLLGGCRI